MNAPVPKIVRVTGIAALVLPIISRWEPSCPPAFAGESGENKNMIAIIVLVTANNEGI